MKIYLCIVCIFFAVAIADDEPGMELTKVFRDCTEELRLIEDSSKPQIIHEQKAKCHHACMMKKFGSLAEGKVVTEKAIEVHEKLSQTEVTDTDKEKMAECANKANEENEECEVAWAFRKCLMEKRHQ